MKICFIPIDNRPVCYNLAKDICSIDSSIELLIPPREFLGDLTKNAKIAEILNWLKSLPKCDAIILSLDTLTYGGLIPSRRSTETFDEIKARVENIKDILKTKDAKIYAFSSIMRISNNNYNEEEKEYWKDYGKKIFEYSFSGGNNKSDIPTEIIDDYLQTRKRNFEINKLYLEWQNEGFLDTLIFSKDDCAEYGFNVNEAKELEMLGGKTKTGADEIPLTLLARALEKKVKIFVEYTEPDSINLISNYEDVSIEKSVQGQIELAGFELVTDKNNADVFLVVNNFREKQGELVMGWDTGKKSQYSLPCDIESKPFAFVDVRYANGADNDFVEQILGKIDSSNFYGYSGWNTSANSIGSLLAIIKSKSAAKVYDEKSFKTLQVIRFLDDWAYQANIRDCIVTPCDVSDSMNTFKDKLLKALAISENLNIKYSFPWSRKFEIEIEIS